jgi:putative aldouronate transport system substrate-binding protein
MKDALAKLQELFNQGLIDPEFVVKDGQKCDELVSANQTGVLYGAHWSSLAPLQNSVNNDPNADWLVCDPPTIDGSPVIVGGEMATGTWFAASSKSAHPEAVVQLANLYCEKTFDPQKQEYEYYSNPGGDAEGVWKLSPVFMMTPHKNIDTTVAIRPHLESGDPGDLYGEQLTMWQYTKAGMDGERDMWGWERVFGIDGACQLQKSQLDRNGQIISQFYAAPTATMSERSTVLGTAFSTEIIKIISGQSPIDAFDAAVQAWLDGGGKQMTDEVNDWYKTRG